jgi:hypothetical protein
LPMRHTALDIVVLLILAIVPANFTFHFFCPPGYGVALSQIGIFRSRFSQCRLVVCILFGQGFRVCHDP